MIFIIEPDLVLAEHYASALLEVDDKVTMFRTASLAVKALNTHMPDIIVLELALPGHNGFELLYELASYADTKTIKVVVHSLLPASSVDWSYTPQTDLGIAAYLYKPDTSLQLLTDTVAEVQDRAATTH
jgi:DNA-binding response OmpR family regulator